MGKSSKEVEAPKGKGRKVMLTDPKTKKEVARVDVIKALWNDGNGKTRGEIRTILAEKYNHDVVYQIVFAATKGSSAKNNSVKDADTKKEATA